METIRAFVALNIDEPLRGEIAQAVTGLKKTGADVRWVAPKNLHFTLKFLGNAPSGIVDRAAAALKGVKQKKFNIVIGGIGAITDAKKRPRVIYADVITGASQLKALAAAVEAALEPLGIEKDHREFLPHLTLGRVKSLKNAEKLFLKIDSAKSSIFGKISVVRFCLMKSDLRPTGPIYTEIAGIPLE